MEVEAIRYENENRGVFCVVYGENITQDDVLLNEEQIRTEALEEALTEEEKYIIRNSIFEIIPDDDNEGKFYVEFRDFY